MLGRVAVELLRRAGAESAFAVEVPRCRHTGSDGNSRWWVCFGCGGKAGDEEEGAGFYGSESGG